MPDRPKQRNYPTTTTAHKTCTIAPGQKSIALKLLHVLGEMIYMEISKRGQDISKIITQ